MRLNSLQIYEEYKIDIALEALGEDKKVLQECFKNIEVLTAKDSESYWTILMLCIKYPDIEKYVDRRLKEIERTIINKLQLSDKQWRENIERLEEIK